jgi:hypothetical protein
MAKVPDEFYLAEARSHLSQGDIYLAPSVVVWASETYPARTIPPAPSGPGQVTYVPAWTTNGPAPAVTLGTSWTPVLVISHDCELDKEFNESVDARVAAGTAEEDAIQDASNDRSLDRHVLISPLLPYEESVVLPERWEAIRATQKIGYFPLPPMPAYEDAEFLVHLSRISTIERALLERCPKVGSTSERARAILRFKLAEAHASRNLTLVSKLESAIGQAITELRTVKVKRGDATVALVLASGEELHVSARADRDPPPPPERLRQSKDLKEG